MKKLLALTFAIIVSIDTIGQTNYINVCEDCDNLYHNFDFNSSTDSTMFFFKIDTSQSDNLWQLGEPMKAIFNTGFWNTKAFLTDSLYPYPTNNVSSFQFSVINCSLNSSGYCGGYNGFMINMAIKINSDYLQDGGTIEVSHNNNPFINIIEDSLASISGDIYSINDTIQSMNKPGFTGINNNWQSIDIGYWREEQFFFDTITFKFTFTSDNIETSKDGWMIGYMFLGGFFETIKENSFHNLFSIFPNPSNNQIEIIPNKENKLEGEITILNSIGNVVIYDRNFSSKYIDISKLSNGIYILTYSDNENFSSVKFVKQ